MSSVYPLIGHFQSKASQAALTLGSPRRRAPALVLWTSYLVRSLLIWSYMINYLVRLKFFLHFLSTSIDTSTLKCKRLRHSRLRSGIQMVYSQRMIACHCIQSIGSPGRSPRMTVAARYGFVLSESAYDEVLL